MTEPFPTRVGGTKIYASHMNAVQDALVQMVFNVKAPNFGAAGDGVTDDTTAYEAALDAAIAAGGGTVYFPPGRYLITRQVNIMRSHITVAGAGRGATTLIFDPSDSNHSTRFTAIHSGDDPTTQLSNPKDIAADIAVGATSFTLDDAGDSDDLEEGDWILVIGYHPNTAYGGPNGEITEFDWMQVASVSGVTVNVMTPFRTAFGRYDGWLFCQKMINLVENVTFRDFTLINLPHPDGFRTLGITISAAKDCTLLNLDIQSQPGPNFSMYRAKNARLLNCNFKSINSSSSEISVAVDVLVESCTFAAEWTEEPPDYTPLLISFGTGFFRCVNNTFVNSTGTMLSVLYGVHDGVITGNVFGFAANKSGGNTGILLRGVQNILIADNSFAGGDASGANSYAINLGHEFPASGAVIYSYGNVLGVNQANGFPSGKYIFSGEPDTASILESKGHSGYRGTAANRTTAAVTTTNNTITDLFIRAITPNSTYQFEIKITARRTDASGRGFYWRRTCVYRGAAGSAAIDTTDTPAADHENGITGTITIDCNVQTFRIRVTGEASKTICWVATIEWQAATAVDA